MKTLVKKEIRLLLPAFILGCLLAYTNLVVPSPLVAPETFSPYWCLLPFVSCPLIAVMLALQSFGAEVGSGTFSALLAQPIPRKTIWNTKILLLALALVVISFFWCATFGIQAMRHGGRVDFRDLLEIVGIFAVVIFSGGLWTVLLLRQVTAAFWFTVLAPAGIAATVFYFGADHSQIFVRRMLILALVSYSIVGFFFARWLFLRAQDVQWTGGNIALPQIRWLSGFKIGSGLNRRWSPRAALQSKEFQLHQSQMVIAGVMVSLHLAVIVVRNVTHFAPTSSIGFILGNFWTLWLLMPVLVGCAAVAEERKLGIFDGQLCLPVRRRTQFMTKIGVVLLLSVVFGMVMPLLLEPSLLQNVLPHNFPLEWDASTRSYWHVQFFLLQTILPMTPLLAVAAGVAAIGFISFYASTLSRNTLQALSLAVVGILLVWFLALGAARPDNFLPTLNGFVPWRGALIYLIGVPALGLVLLFLASRNCRHLIITGQVWFQNLMVLLATGALVTITTTALYHRVWEKLTPFEPSHGQAQLTLANPPVMRDDWGGFSVRLPDGRVWGAGYYFGGQELLPWLLGNIRLNTVGYTGQKNACLYQDSNWRNVMGSPQSEEIGIKTDGTLWASEKPARHKLRGGVWQTEAAGPLTQYGAETNWNSFIWINNIALITKTDGTLWQWGETNRQYPWPSFRAYPLKRLGTNSDWAEAFSSGGRLWLCKTDGRIWGDWFVGKPDSELSKQLGVPFGRMPFKLELPAGNKTKGALDMLNDGTALAVPGDGSFRIVAWLGTEMGGGLVGTDLQLGSGTNWLAIAGRGGRIVTLKDDGTIWVWDLGLDMWRGDRQRHYLPESRQLGTHSDWVDIASADDGIVSLAADGSLWYWVLEDSGTITGDLERMNPSGRLLLPPLVEVSRKPLYLGNVLTAAN